MFLGRGFYVTISTRPSMVIFVRGQWPAMSTISARVPTMSARFRVMPLIAAGVRSFPPVTTRFRSVPPIAAVGVRLRSQMTLLGHH